MARPGLHGAVFVAVRGAGAADDEAPKARSSDEDVVVPKRKLSNITEASFEGHAPQSLERRRKLRPGPSQDLVQHAADTLLNDCSVEDGHDAIDYGASNFKENLRVGNGPVPLRVRFRELFCGSGAFFSLFGWRFLRRSLKGIWRPQLTYTAFAALLVACMKAVPPDSRQNLENSIRSFTVLFEFTRIFLVFTLTAVVGTMYSRWWEMRKLTGIVMGRTTDTTVIIATYIQGEDTASLKCDLVRYLNLAHILLLMQARSKHGRGPLFELNDLLLADLITASEQDILEEHEALVSLYNVAYMWFLQLWLEALRDGLVPVAAAGGVHKSVQENVSMMRQAAGDIFMYQNTPPPVGYFRVLYSLLNVSLVISPFGVYATLLNKGNNQWMVVPVVFVVTFFLLSFIHMCHEMFDPFADGLSHFPLKHYLGSTMRSSFALLEMPREGRLRYYSTMQRVRPRGASEEDDRAKVLEAEQQLRLSIREKSVSTRSVHLFGSCLHDRSDQAAMEDLHEGHMLLCRRPSMPIIGAWLGSHALQPEAANCRVGAEEELPAPPKRRVRSISSIN